MMIATVTSLISARRSTFARRIKASMSKSVEGFVEAGKALIEAKEALEHGQFEALVVVDLGMKTTAAQRLMMIARHPVISNPANLPLLPALWTTLYTLTRVPERILRARIASGAVNPSMSGKDAAALLPRPRVTRQSQPETEEEEDAPENPQETIHNMLLYRASEAIAGAHFPRGSLARYTPDRQALQLAREAADAWNQLATSLERRSQ